MAGSLLFLLIGSGTNCTAQEASNPPGQSSANELLQGSPDVTIFVIPTSGDTARVALAFNMRVSHAHVRQEIGKLEVNGWGVGPDLGVEDGTIRPGDTQRAPITTSAHFTLYKAPQVLNNAPALLPYLKAFEDQNRVAVIFNLSELKPYNGIDFVDSSGLLVRRITEENAYHYEALIRDHHGPLPEFAMGSAARTSASTPAVDPASPKPVIVPMLPLMLILLGGGILGGLAVYAWLMKRASRAVPTRNARS